MNSKNQVKMKPSNYLLCSMIITFFLSNEVGAQTKHFENGINEKAYFYISENQNDDGGTFWKYPTKKLDINLSENDLKPVLKSGLMFYLNELDYDFGFEDTVSIAIEQKDTLKVRMNIITGSQAGAIGAVFEDTTQTEFKLVGEDFMLAGLIIVGNSAYNIYAVDFYIIANNSAALGRYEHNLLTFAFNSSGSLIACSPEERKFYIDVIKEGYRVFPNFSADTTKGDAPLTVKFTDESSGIITAREWDFGDGNTSTETNPTHVYTQPGEYAVSLKTSNEYMSDTEEKENYIDVLDPDAVEAKFSHMVSDTNNFVAIFTDESVGNITNWFWDFGDGSTSVVESPDHIYEEYGEYTVSLKVCNNVNCDSISDEIEIDRKIWKFETEGDVLSSPAIRADGTIYAGSKDGFLYAINPDGTLMWNFDAGINYSSPTIGPDGTIYIGSYIDNCLYAVNPDGTLNWKHETGDGVNSSPAVGIDGTIYIGCNDNYLYAINPDNTLKWKYSADGDIGMSSPSMISDTV